MSGPVLKSIVYRRFENTGEPDVAVYWPPKAEVRFEMAKAALNQVLCESHNNRVKRLNDGNAHEPWSRS